ncbi:hypothetical protein AVEN_138607-2-1, partial [Araneus ventricosus]
HSSKFLVSSEPQVTRDTISSSLKTSQHSNVESSLRHCSTASSSTFSEQSGWTQGRLEESNTIGKVEKDAFFPHIPTAAICAFFYGGSSRIIRKPDNPIPVNRESTVFRLVSVWCFGKNVNFKVWIILT